MKKFLLLSVAMLASPTLAQDTINIGTGDRKLPEVAPVKVKSGIVIEPTPMVRKTERRQVFDWPDRDITFAAPGNWSRPIRAIAANYPPSALALERVYGRAPTPCLTFYDRIDLTMVRKRGFTVAGFSAEPLPPRYGYSLSSPVEAIAVNSREGDRYTAFLDKADQIRIRPPLFTKHEGSLQGCWSGYRLTVTLEGPVGVDPFAPGPTRPRYR